MTLRLKSQDYPSTEVSGLKWMNINMKSSTYKSDQMTEGILDYLEEKGEQDLLSEVTKSLQGQLAKKEQTNEIVVTSVVKLSSPQLAKIKSIFYKKMNLKMPAINKIDKSLLGGFTIRVNDWFLDASVGNQIKIFKRLLLAN